MTVSYDPERTTPAELAKVIEGLGFTCELGRQSVFTAPAPRAKRPAAVVPQGAPSFFVDAFARARAANRPVVLDFWARWCSPCLRLKNETLEDPTVKAALANVELVYVDLDEYPRLGEAYGVASVPDVVFVDRDGIIVDRLQTYEPPDRFLIRLRKLLGQ